MSERPVLCVGGVLLTEVADEFRTPTYVLDEADFRHRVRRYRSALPGVEVVYATPAAHSIGTRYIGDEVFLNLTDLGNRLR